MSSINLVQQWGMNQNGCNEKVPSRIGYFAPGTSATETIYGNEIKPNTKAAVHTCMKLKLDDQMARSSQFREFLQHMDRNFGGLQLDDNPDSDEDGRMVDDDMDAPPPYPGKTTVEIVADYLKYVRKTSYKVIEKQYRSAMLESMRKELVVTVPAVWSERAKDQTMKAVEKSGWRADATLLVTEPEAAAVYTLKSMMEGVSKSEVKVGDVFVLTDCGGGTVDLISYKITQVSPVFRIEEAAVGTGDKCGATYVDKASAQCGLSRDRQLMILSLIQALRLT